MGVIVVGISHKTAPIEIREKLAIPPDRLGLELSRLFETGNHLESVVLSTCNRVEVYARPKNDSTQSIRALNAFFQELYGHPRVAQALYSHDSLAAVQHLFRVASGLDSMVVGETEVLGQVKSAYTFAQAQGTTGKITNVLFQRALHVGKLIRTRTNISEGSSSVGAIAVQLAERIFGQLQHHRILLVGAGKMAEITARHLLSQKAGEIMILNRTLDKAQALAQLLNGSAGSIDRLPDELLKADIVICSTASDQPIISRWLVEATMRARKGRSLYFVDIAVPRNVDPGIHELDNVYVYNIDDLRHIVDEAMSRRKSDVLNAETIVNTFASEFYDWIRASLDGKNVALRHAPMDGPPLKEQA